MADTLTFGKGEAVIYIGPTDELKDAKGWVVRVFRDQKRVCDFVQVDFPAHRHPHNRNGYHAMPPSSLKRASADPDAAGDQTTNEATYTGYARKGVADTFTQGDAVVYICDNNRILPKGTKGWVIGEFRDRRGVRFVRVNFPTHRNRSRVTGYWNIHHIELERSPSLSSVPGLPASHVSVLYGTPGAGKSTLLPVNSSAEILIENEPKTINPSFPHACPRCGGPAYVGFTSFKCSKGCR